MGPASTGEGEAASADTREHAQGRGQVPPALRAGPRLSAGLSKRGGLGRRLPAGGLQQARLDTIWPGAARSTWAQSSQGWGDGRCLCGPLAGARTPWVPRLHGFLHGFHVRQAGKAGGHRLAVGGRPSSGGSRPRQVGTLVPAARLVGHLCVFQVLPSDCQALGKGDLLSWPGLPRRMFSWMWAP